MTARQHMAAADRVALTPNPSPLVMGLAALLLCLLAAWPASAQGDRKLDRHMRERADTPDDGTPARAIVTLRPGARLRAAAAGACRRR